MYTQLSIMFYHPYVKRNDSIRGGRHFVFCEMIMKANKKVNH